ncbi:MAG: hypothetical protein Q9M16_09645 [Mariprofundus sp.]|nr:hypothetical protein [Mariprofundus sp.]
MTPKVFTKAIKAEVFNSDQGAQYTSTGFSDILKENGIKVLDQGATSQCLILRKRSSSAAAIINH